MNFALKGNKSTSKIMIRKSVNKCQLLNIDKYTKANEMLDLIKEKILELVPEEKVEDDGFDYLTSWQIVSTVVCYLYCELLECYTSAFSFISSSFSSSASSSSASSSASSSSSSSSSSSYYTSRSDVIHSKHNTTTNQDYSDVGSSRNNENNDPNNTNKKNQNKYVKFICKSLTSIYDLLEAILEVLVVRERYTNPKQIREYFLLLSQLCQIITKIEENKIVKDVIKSRSVVNENTQKSRENCTFMVVELARKIRDAGEFMNH